MGLLPDWLSAYFQQPTPRDSNGNDQNTREFWKFIGIAITDDVANGQLVFQVLALDPVVHLLTSAANGPTYNVTETDGDVRFSIRTLTAAFTVVFPANPTVGMRIGVKAADATFSATFSITVNGNGHNVEWGGVGAATFVMTPASVGNGANMVWMWDGTAWVSQ